MVQVKENLIGKRFWRLVVTRQAEDYIRPNGIHEARWYCDCDCGNKDVIINGSALKSKTKPTKSCGCIKTEIIKEASKNNKKGNKYDLTREYGVGWTSNTNEEFYFDLEDYNKIKDYTWYTRTNNQGYKELLSKCDNKTIKMHWIVFEKNCDHKNMNTLDNRKENLRKATNSQNNTNQHKQSNNTSGFIGVSFDRETNKWAAYINIDKKRKRIGRFISLKDAVMARLNAESKYYGEFAPQRELFKQYKINAGDN